MSNFNLISKCSMMSIALAIGCSLQPVSAQTVSDVVTISQRPPNPPPSPPPNDTRPGGGLSPQDSSCNSLNRSMQALIPVTNPVLTTTNSPTFLFYIPFAADQVQFGEFSLLTWPGEEQRLYQVRFTLPQTPGIVSVSLPPQTGLQEGDSYRWYFQLYCQDDTGTQPDLTVNGMVERVALTPDREGQIQAATPDIWYDALAQVATQLQASPEDPQLREKWRSLLQSIDAEDLATEAIVGSVIPIQVPSEP